MSKRLCSGGITVFLSRHINTARHTLTCLWTFPAQRSPSIHLNGGRKMLVKADEVQSPFMMLLGMEPDSLITGWTLWIQIIWEIRGTVGSLCMTVGVWIDSSGTQTLWNPFMCGLCLVANTSPKKRNARGDRLQSIPVCDQQHCAYQESGSIEVSKEAKVGR